MKPRADADDASSHRPHWPHWPVVGRWLTVALLVVVIVLLTRAARQIDWRQVATAIGNYQLPTLLLGLALTAISYACYAGFDLLGRHYAHAHVNSRYMMGTAFVSYALNQNVGALLGTVGMRLRLYTQIGLSPAEISKIITLGVITNWLGYCTLAGVLLTLNQVRVPAQWGIHPGVLQAIGIGMLLLVCVYLYACSSGRSVGFRRLRFEFPPLAIACMQLVQSMTHWLSTIGILYVLLNQQIPYFTVMGTYMLTSIATVITHLPAGLGLLEALFVALLSSRLPVPDILAAVLVFRAMFNLMALIVGGIVYLLLENAARSKPQPGKQADKQATPQTATRG